MSMPVNLLTKSGATATTGKTIPDATSWPDEIVWNSRFLKYVNATTGVGGDHQRRQLHREFRAGDRVINNVSTRSNHMSIQFHDDDQIQLAGESRWQSAREMRAAGYSDDELDIVVTYGAVKRHTQLRTTEAKSYPPPDPYAAPIAAMRHASATTELDFEDRWKADRLAALNAEHRRLDAHLDEHPTPRMAEGRKSYPPPDGYQLALRKENR